MGAGQARDFFRFVLSYKNIFNRRWTLINADGKNMETGWKPYPTVLGITSAEVLVASADVDFNSPGDHGSYNSEVTMSP